MVIRVRRRPSPTAYIRVLRAARVRGHQIGRAGLVRLQKQFTAAADRLASVTTESPLSTMRAASLRKQINTTLTSLTKAVTSETERGVRLTADQLAELHYRGVRQIVDAAGIDVDATALRAAFDTVPIRVMAALNARRGGTAATFRTLYNRHIQEAADDLDTLIGSGIARGVSARTLAKDIAALLGGERVPGVSTTYGLRDTDVSGLKTLWYDARRIAVSEINNTMREANAVSMQASGIIAAAKWQLSGAHPVEDECDDLAEADDYGYGPGMYPPDAWPDAPHPFCLHPDAPVRGSLLLALRSQYAGDMLQIVTASGQRVTVTPNHPVLTTAGFVAASQLRKGDYVCRDLRRVGLAAPRVQNPENAPARAEDVFRAFAETSPITTCQRSAQHLHGDAAHGQGNIEIVGAEGVSLPWVKTRERLSQRVLVSPAMQETLIDGASPTNLAVERIMTAAPRAMRGPDEMEWVTTRFLESSPIDQPGVGTAAHRDAMLRQPSSQRESRHASDGREHLDRLTGQIAFDQVVEIGYGFFRGHVYDFQSEDGLIITSDILISNCACMQGGPIAYVDPAEWPSYYETSGRGGGVDSVEGGGRKKKDAADAEPLQPTAQNPWVNQMSAPVAHDNPMEYAVAEEVKEAGGVYAFEQANGGENAIVRRMWDEQGFNERPPLVSKKMMDELVRQPNVSELWRGVVDRAHAEQFVSGERYIGNGAYGNGDYTTETVTRARMYLESFPRPELWGQGAGPELDAFHEASAYAYDKGSVVMRMALSPSAKVVEWNDLTKEFADWKVKVWDRLSASTSFPNEPYRDPILYPGYKQPPLEIEGQLSTYIFTDPARFATMRGYDAILVRDEGYLVVLNRSAVVVERGYYKPYRGGKSPTLKPTKFP